MFEYSDAQQAEAIGWLTFFVLLMGTVAVGCVLHGLHREYRRFLHDRQVAARWREILEEEAK